MKINANLVKYGNSHYFRVRKEFVNNGMLITGKSYTMELKSEYEELANTNILLAEKLKEANKILESQGLGSIEINSDIDVQLDNVKNTLKEKLNLQVEEKEDEIHPENAKIQIRTVDALQLVQLILFLNET